MFPDRAAAEQARQAYVERYAEYPLDDHWREQAYHYVSIPADVVIQPIASEEVVPLGTEVFVVSLYVEAFGQIVRTMESVHLTEAAARQAAEQLQASETEWPASTSIQQVRVGDLLSDGPADQPRYR